MQDDLAVDGLAIVRYLTNPQIFIQRVARHRDHSKSRARGLWEGPCIALQGRVARTSVRASYQSAWFTLARRVRWRLPAISSFRKRKRPRSTSLVTTPPISVRQTPRAKAQ